MTSSRRAGRRGSAAALSRLAIGAALASGCGQTEAPRPPELTGMPAPRTKFATITPDAGLAAVDPPEGASSEGMSPDAGDDVALTADGGL
jgi:hypothetical protein